MALRREMVRNVLALMERHPTGLFGRGLTYNRSHFCMQDGTSRTLAAHSSKVHMIDMDIQLPKYIAWQKHVRTNQQFYRLKLTEY
jgi:hypothetical protein